MVEELRGCKEHRSARIAMKQHNKDHKKRKVKLHGTLRPRDPPSDSVQCMSLNPNGMRMWKHNNHKASRLKSVMCSYHLDAVGLQEVCINWANYKPSQTLASLLNTGFEPIRNVRGYNEHESENIGNVQRGGIAALLRGPLTQFVKDQGNDHRKLGRWSWYKVEGEAGHITRFVSAYAPVGSRGGSGPKSNYKQQEQYIQEQGLRTTPR